jgi:secretion/DNA translocation related CpaE-like protein
VLVVSADAALVADLRRLAVAAGVDADVMAPDGLACEGGRFEAGEAARRWQRAALVVLDPDAAAVLVRGGPARRRGVLLAARAGGDVGGAPAKSWWQAAVDCGAEHVALLPEAEPWLVERFAALGRSASPAAHVVGVVGGRGGAGASVLAAALALTAAESGRRSLLLDADPLGGGVDLLLGAETAPGVRWPDLAAARGRLAPGSVSGAVPSVDGVGLLSWHRGAPVEIPTEAVRAVLDEVIGCWDLVVVDLPRVTTSLSREMADRCRRILVVVPAEVRASAAAGSVAAALAGTTELALVVRGPAPTGLPAEAVAEGLGLPLVGCLRAEGGIAATLDRGELFALRERGPLRTLCRKLLAREAS